MRILYLGKNQDNFYAAEWYYMLRWLAKTQDFHVHGPTLAGPSSLLKYVNVDRLGRLMAPFSNLTGHLSGIVRSSIETDIVKVCRQVEPEVIFIDSFFPPSPAWRNLVEVDIPKAILVSDPHYMLREKLQYITRNHVDLCLFDHKFVMDLKLFHSWRSRNEAVALGWLPHCVNTEVFRDYAFSRTIDVASSGSTVQSIYPLRYKIMTELQRVTDFKFVMPPHARYDMARGKAASGALIRDNYAKFLAHSKIFIFDSSIYNYALMKYTEGMACKSLVMAPTPHDAENLHFIAGENFVEVNEANFLNKIRYYLRHEEERNEISENGMNTVLKYHTLEKRCEELVTYLGALL